MLGYLAHYAMKCPASSLDALQLVAEKSRLSAPSHLLHAALERRHNDNAAPRMDVNGYDHDSWQEDNMAKLREGLLGPQGNDLMDIDGGDWQEAVLLRVDTLLSR